MKDNNIQEIKENNINQSNEIVNTIKSEITDNEIEKSLENNENIRKYDKTLSEIKSTDNNILEVEEKVGVIEKNMNFSKIKEENTENNNEIIEEKEIDSKNNQEIVIKTEENNIEIDNTERNFLYFENEQELCVKLDHSKMSDLVIYLNIINKKLSQYFIPFKLVSASPYIKERNNFELDNNMVWLIYDSTNCHFFNDAVGEFLSHHTSFSLKLFKDCLEIILHLIIFNQDFSTCNIHMFFIFNNQFNGDFENTNSSLETNKNVCFKFIFHSKFLFN